VCETVSRNFKSKKFENSDSDCVESSHQHEFPIDSL
jgi:hypothetical protein